MTKINRIILHGFKSFARRTEIVFGDHFNSVLGPNGSGKSNVLDAICFVLGRASAKSLRAEKSANLIYNGGKKKKPAAKAEVSIFFDNTNKVFPVEEKEIKITRIVKKNGQSTYKINDKRRTRAQILDMMSIAKIDPEGYNIILQGDIIKFVEMSSTERRLIVEEIAGISIYEDKKNKALNELDKVEGKLQEADIILAERETYLRELKKERDQAARYTNTKERIDSSKATVLHYRIKAKKEEKEGFDKKVDSNKSNLEKTNEEIEKFKEKISIFRAEIEEITDEIEEKGEKEQVKILKDIEGSRIQIATDKTNVENYKKELEKIKQRRAQLKEDSREVGNKSSGLESRIKELEKKKLTIEREQTQIQNTIDDFKRKNKLGDIPEIEAEVQEIDQHAEELQEKIQKLREQQQNLLRDKDKVEYQLQTLDDRLDKLKDVKKEHKKEVEDLKKKRDEFKKSTLELNKCLTEDSSLAVQLSKNRDELLIKREELEKLKARSVGIRERAAANIAVQKILEQKKNIQGIYGTVAELGKVSAKYSLALEIAAGARMNNIVVKDDRVAAEAIKYLKQNKLGTATFLPLNKLKFRPTKHEVKALEKTRGVQGVATKFVDYDSKYEVVFLYIFSNTLVVDNIDVARRIGIGKSRMVTVDGDLAELSGAITGGYRKKRAGIGFQEKEASKEMSKLEVRVQELDDLVKILQKRREENEDKIVELRQNKASLEGEIIKVEKSLHLEEGDVDVDKKQQDHLMDKLKRFDSEITEVNKDIQEVNTDLAKVKVQKQELRTKINQLQNPTLLAELNTFEDKKAELRDEFIQTEHAIKAIEMQIKDMLAPELEKIGKVVKQLDKDDNDFKKEIKTLDEKIERDSKVLKEEEKKQRQFITKFKELFAQRDTINNKIQKIEGDKIRKEEQSRQIELRINNWSLKNASVTAELAGLEKEYEQYHGVKLSRERSEMALKAEITRFENMVAEMGNVNLRALEIYDSVETEYKTLISKKDILGKEKEDVLAMMAEIEEKKGDLFIKAFDGVNEHFRRIFDTLTSKGSAYLMMEDPKNPFEGGVLIKVKISGKRFLDIRSLSGGEKTLTALAFIFSIQEHDPASFYVLDEVDAALDKHNSERFSKLVRKYSDTAQYIIITHNDAVISEADNLYGVSMDEHSISKVVSLKI